MTPFVYHRARDVTHALGLAQEEGAAFVAGGTTILDLMKEGVEAPTALIDINWIEGSRKVALEADGLRIGSLARNSDVAGDPLVMSRWPLLSQALLAGASPQLRNMASIGGNLMQRTRCPYFRDDTFACNKRTPGSGCSARSGYNRGHAVLGVSDQCIATHPSDMAVALMAFGGHVRVIGHAGSRDIAFADFYRLPRETPHIETALGAGELIDSIWVAAPPVGSRMTYLKVRDRAAYEFALTSAAVILRIQNGKIDAAPLALGGVATIPWRAAVAERFLIGKVPKASVFQAAARLIFANAETRPFNAFKVDLGQRTVARALMQAAELT